MKRTAGQGTKEEFITNASNLLTDSLKRSLPHIRNYLREPLCAEQGDVLDLRDLSVTSTYTKPPAWTFTEEQLKYPLIDFGWGHLPGIIFTAFFNF